MKVLLTIFLNSLLVVSTLAASEISLQLPLKESQVSPFPLRLLASSDNAGQRDGINTVVPLGLQDAQCLISIEAISITGQDVAGKKWELRLHENIGLGYQLYSGDLDKNGYADAVLVTYTAANGFLPNCILSIITFDTQGRPLLWQDGQDVETVSTGIVQIVDLDQDGKAELITNHYDYDGGDKWDGYYVANIYKLENARWHKLSQYAGQQFSVYTHYSPKDTGDCLIRKPEMLPGNRRPFAPDLSNNLPVIKGKALRIEQSERGLATFKVRTPTGKITRIRRDYIGPGRAEDKCYTGELILVVDTEQKREISVIDSSNEARIKQELSGQKIELYGTCAAGKLSPNLIWITK